MGSYPRNENFSRVGSIHFRIDASLSEIGVKFFPANNMFTELIGWSAAAILLLTIGRQVFTEWRDRSTRGLSKWLFVGQFAASAGFVVYSWLLKNWVFVITNSLLLGTSAIGQWIFIRNKRREKLRTRNFP